MNFSADNADEYRMVEGPRPCGPLLTEIFRSQKTKNSDSWFHGF